jgi:hypothetical protein
MSHVYFCLFLDADVYYCTVSNLVSLFRVEIQLQIMYVYVTDKDDNSANNVIGRSMTIMASQVGH